MQSFVHKIKALKCGWNERPLDEAAFHKLTRKLKIKVQLMPLSVEGFYNCTKGKHYISINSRLSAARAEFVRFHELGHFLMHMPSTDPTSSYCGSETYSRDENEADAFAYCALLPLTTFEKYSVEEIAGMYGSEFLMRRLEVYERYKI